MNKFTTAYNITIGHEGGYVNDPDDRGGETYIGITRINYPDWDGWKIIDVYTTKYQGAALNSRLSNNPGLTGYVEQFYYENYWLPIHGDSFHQRVSNELFDTAVNQGLGTSVKYLQQALNKLNRNQKDYPDITVDGGIGFITESAYTSLMKTERFGSRNIEKLEKWLLKWLNYYQLKRYDLITNNDLTQEKFIPGWTERT
ncbi:MAG: glycosyl hydrolase 108 family protein [Bacteroidota bacterium]